MAKQIWEEFWWNSITGPSIVVSKVTYALLENEMVVLQVPSDLPWRHSMRGAIQSTFRSKSDSFEIVIESIDATDENPTNMDPGRFILDRYASRDVTLGYRQRSKRTIQEYISAKKVIKNRIIWVKGIDGKTAEQWVSFCNGFNKRSVEEGLFVLEVQRKINMPDNAALRLINFSNIVSDYDVQLFISFMLNGKSSLSDIWKRYISTVTALVCDVDAEISAKLLNTVNFQEESVIDGLKRISEMPIYSKRGKDNPNHVLWLCRNNGYKELQHRIWSAQVQVLFPIIELERVSLVEKWEQQIQDVLDNNHILQYSEPLYEAMNAELGTIFHLMKKRDSTGKYILRIPDTRDRERIEFLHDCRNQLAHATCCNPEQVKELLE